MEWTDDRVREALQVTGPGGSRRYTAVATDTRSLTPGSLFVALAGERFDGHDHLEAALAAGAEAAVVRTGTVPVDGLPQYEVPDTLRAYGWLARHRRRFITGPVIAVTGTNGKTSTKEMLAAALGTRFRVYATRANLNNLVGVPQTILEAPADTEALVVEAGANLPGEIARYREIIEPDLSLVTNVAAGHLEGFGSLEGVRREKLSLVRGVPVAIIGGDDATLAEAALAAGAGRVVTAGLGAADVRPESVELDPAGRAVVVVDGHRFTLPQLGRHQAANAMLAWAAGRELGLDPAAVARALESVTIPGGRGEIRTVGRLTILNDSYNANPASFSALIELVRSMRAGRRLVFVAGTMRELGPDAAALHSRVAADLAALDPDLLGAVGEFGPALEAYRERMGGRLFVAPDAETMGRLLGPQLSGEELVVLKGSRGVALERMVPDLIRAAEG